MARITNMASVESGTHIEEYSPNIRSSALHKQTVELVLMQWWYKAVYQVEIKTNLTGVALLDAAIESLYFDEIAPADDDKVASITLSDADGGELICDDDDLREEDWLKEMVISARIVTHTLPTINEVLVANGREPSEDGDCPIPL